MYTYCWAIGKIHHRYDWKNESNYTLWILNSVGIPISLLVIPLGFLVYLNTMNSGILCGKCRKRHKRIYYEGCLQVCCAKKTQSTEDGTEQLNTNPSSPDPAYVRSYTHWSVPYTGQFTSISVSQCRSLTMYNSRLFSIYPASQSLYHCVA